MDIQAVRSTAAASGCLPTVMYMLGVEPAASAAQLTHVLNVAGANNKLRVAKWLRQQGAEWPEELRINPFSWKGNVLQWARDEGCTAPTTTATA
jgi:hypothetical protein